MIEGGVLTSPFFYDRKYGSPDPFNIYHMTTRATIVSILILILLSVGAYFIFRNNSTTVPNQIPNNNSTTTSSTIVYKDLIRISAPASNALVASPLTVRGEARGNWYFEASFPLKVLDANGTQIGVGYAQAEGEWMTTDYVPFLGTITFTAPTTTTGMIVFEKDNPSGLPENSDEIRVPVRFQ